MWLDIAIYAFGKLTQCLIDFIHHILVMVPLLIYLFGRIYGGKLNAFVISFLSLFSLEFKEFSLLPGSTFSAWLLPLGILNSRGIFLDRE